MKKIGKLFGVVGFLLPLLALFFSQALAQNSVSVSASVSKTTIYAGERVNFSIKINGSFNNVSRPDLPDFNGLRLLSNTPSTSRSYRFRNGKSSTSYTYSYSLIAQQTGKHKIPPASITIDGKKYKTEPINIRVIDRNTAKSSGNEQRDIFVQLEVSDSQPVPGQQIITDVVLYFKDGLEVNSYQPVPGWKAEGFWKEELESSKRPQASSTIINGVRYRKARLLQFALFPTKAGSLKISPYNIVVSIRSSRSDNDPFSSFFGRSNQRQVELSSEGVTLDVQPLPPAKNSTYIGAVGNYNISRSISTKSAVVGESIELVTSIEGTGNIPLITKPEYDLPDGLEVYEPKQNSSLNRENEQISGSQTFTDVLVARSPGSYVIPQKKISYFNPSQNKYVSKTMAALRIDVNENPEKVTASNTPNSFPVNPVTGLASWTAPVSVNLIGHWWFWVGILLPLVVLGVAYWQKSFIKKMETDEAFSRSHKAFDKASAKLEKAISRSKNGEIKEAYNMLQKALTGFISDRLTLAEAGLSNADYVKALEDENIDDELIKNVRMLLDKCASISYAPNTTHEYLKSHVGLAESTLEKLKKVL